MSMKKQIHYDSLKKVTSADVAEASVLAELPASEWMEVARFLAEGAALFEQRGNHDAARKLKLGGVAAGVMAFRRNEKKRA